MTTKLSDFISDGFTGFTGSQGETGFTGSQGDIGFTGSAGFIGSQGTTGFTGSQGDVGFTGSTASIPDQIVVLNNISSSFNGTSTQFTISDSSGNFINSEIDSVARLIISVGGIVQQPDPTQNSGFYISGGTDRTNDPIVINFVEPPKSGEEFFGVAVKSTSSPTTSFVTAEESISYSIVFGV
jgi:hypothetical protein